MTSQFHYFKLLLIAATLALGAGASFSATLDVGGIKIEDTLAIYNNTLLLNGAGVVATVKVPQYVAHIYAKKKFASLDALIASPGPKRLVLTAVKEVDTGAIVKMFNRNLEASASKTDMAKLIPGLVNIGNIFKIHKALKPGEVMTFDWIPITGFVIYIGGKMQGDPMRQPELFRAAMGVWMGDPPADTEVKSALLGQM